MARLTHFALLAAFLTVATSGTPARAGNWFDEISAEMHVGYWRNTCWPKPFVYADRQAAFAPMHVMAENGWRRNNLLGEHHFTPDGMHLNTAGELRVRWILTQAPVHRRNIFIERALEPEVTGRRIETVQQFAGTVVPEGTASVFDTHILSEGKSAVDVDRTNNMYRQNAPIPVLPRGTAGTSVTE